MSEVITPATEPTTEPTDLVDLLNEATLPTVSPGVAKYCSQQLGYFSLRNTNRRTLTLTEAMAPSILANRPDLLVKLNGAELAAAVATAFANQVKEYAASIGMNCYPKRAAATVTFRFTTAKSDDDDATDDDATDATS